jgi:hypothetical protein
MSFASQSLHRAGTLVVLVILLSILAAVLFGSFSLMLPRHQWTVWRVPILIAAGGAVALVIVCASYSSMRPRIMDGLAVVLGLASAIPGIGITLLIVYGLGLHIAEHKGSWESLMYQLTDARSLWQIAEFAIIPAVPGVGGLWIARRRLREMGPVSLAGMAARFSTLGLGLTTMIAVAVTVGALCRRVMWP